MPCKRLHPGIPANSNEREDALPQLAHKSSVSIRSGQIATGNVIQTLPEDALMQLHDGLDRDYGITIAPQNAVLTFLRSSFEERLFPLSDQRRYIVRLRLHSQVTAIAASIVAKRAHLGPETAYICGCLHDCGIASCLRHLDELYPVGTDHELDSVWPLVLRSRAEHTCHLASRWRLPSTLRHFLREYASKTNHNASSPMNSVVFVAEHLAAVQGCGFRDEQPIIGLHRSLAALEMTERDLLPLSRTLENSLGEREIEWESLRLLIEA